MYTYIGSFWTYVCMVCRQICCACTFIVHSYILRSRPKVAVFTYMRDCWFVYYCLLLFVYTAPVTISQHPVGRTYKAGQVVQLRCEAHCQPGNPLYQWFSWRDNAPFPLVGAVTSTLCFDSIGVEHTGKYCCRATNPYMEKDEEGFEVFSKWANILVVGQ